MPTTPLGYIDYPAENDNDWYTEAQSGLELWLSRIELMGIPTYSTFADLPDPANTKAYDASANQPQRQFAAVVDETMLYRVNDAQDSWVEWLGSGDFLPLTGGTLTGDVDVDWDNGNTTNQAEKVTWNAADDTPTALLLVDQTESGARLVGNLHGWRRSNSSATTTLSHTMAISLSNNSPPEKGSFHMQTEGHDGALDPPDLISCTYDGNDYYAIRYQGSGASHYPHRMVFRGSRSGSFRLEAVPLADVTNVASEASQGGKTVNGTFDVTDDVLFDLNQASSGSASSGDVPEADGTGGISWNAPGSSTASIVSNLSVQNWNVIDVGNEGFPGDRSGGDLAQFIADNYDPNGYTKFVLPAGTYEWQQSLQWDNTAEDLTIPEGLQIVGKPKATIYVTSGVQADTGYCFDLGRAYGDHTNQMENCYVANLHFDVGNENASRDAGIGRHQTGKNCLFENLSITRRYRRNDDGTTNGGRFIWRLDVGDKESTTICRNFDFTEGERYNDNNDETVGHTIPISAENDHVGTVVYEGCQVAGTVDNGFYLKDGTGTCHVRQCYAKNCGGGAFRLGRNDRMESCTVEYTGAADYYGAGLWLQEGQNTSVDGLRMDVETGINDCIRFTDLMGGVDLANIQIDLANTGDFVLRDSNSTVNEGMIHFRDSTIHDACDGSTREGAIEMRNQNYTFDNLTWYATGGRLPFTQRHTGTKNCKVKDSYFELNDIGVARAGSNLDAPDVDYIFDNCEFVNTAGTDPGLIWDGRTSNTNERLVIRDCDCRDFTSLFYSSGGAMTDFNVGELRSNLGYGNTVNNSYTGP